MQSYEAYEKKWLGTSQPESFLADLAKSMEDPRNAALLWEDDASKTVAYLWMQFTDVPDYDMVIAEVRETAVFEPHRGKGLGTRILQYAEKKAREGGANLLRSDAGVENHASRRVQEKGGLSAYRVQYEKLLSVVDVVHLPGVE